MANRRKLIENLQDSLFTLKNQAWDTWGNILTGVGFKRRDKTENNIFNEYKIFDDTELSFMYMGDGLTKKIIRIPAEDATREWVEITNDEDNVIENRCNDLKLANMFQRALVYTRLYRGAIIVVVRKGETDLALPLSPNDNGRQPIQMLRVFSASRVEIFSSHIIQSPLSEYFDDIEYFPIQFISGELVNVHASRCIVFKGEPAPDDNHVDFQYRFWGVPIITSLYSRISNFGVSEKAITNLLYECSVGKYTIANLAEMLAMNNEKGVDALLNRIETINVSKSTIGAVLLGKEEEYTNESVTFTGVPEILNFLMVVLSAVSNIPAIKLWGEAPKGLNASGDNELRMYYDMISDFQKNYLQPQLDKFFNMLKKDFKLDHIDYEFNSLWQVTEKEKADIEKTQAETDKIYLETGVVLPEEIRTKRDFEELDMGMFEDEDIDNGNEVDMN